MPSVIVRFVIRIDSPGRSKFVHSDAFRIPILEPIIGPKNPTKGIVRIFVPIL